MLSLSGATSFGSAKREDVSIENVISPMRTFSPKDWVDSFGISRKMGFAHFPVSVEKIRIILNEDCHFNVGMKLSETCVLVYYPEFLDDERFTLDSFECMLHFKRNQKIISPQGITKFEFPGETPKYWEHPFFQNKRPRFRWLLIYSGPAVPLPGMTLAEQQANVPFGYRMLRASEVIPYLYLDYIKFDSGQKRDFVGRTCDSLSDDTSISVYSRYYPDTGIMMSDEWKTKSDPGLGVFLARKLE